MNIDYFIQQPTKSLRAVNKSIIFAVSALSICYSLIFCDCENHQKPLLIADTLNQSGLPVHFRSVNVSLNKSNKTKYRLYKGLNKLFASGSGQFTDKTLKEMLTRIPNNNIIIIDLRQEFHGFINKIPICWYCPRNISNEDKTADEIEDGELKHLKNLLLKKHALVCILTKTSDNKKVIDKTLNLPVNSYATEQQLVTEINLPYLRLPVINYHIPSNAHIDQFVDFVKKKPANTWFHFHCRMGKGRTTMFLILFDIMHNAHKVSLANIIKRQLLLANLEYVLEKKEWQKRLKLFKYFYDYCIDNYKSNFNQPWSYWIKLNKFEREKP